MPRHQLKHLPKMVMAWYTYHVAVIAVSEFVRLVRMNVLVKQNLYVAINTKVHFILILLLILIFLDTHCAIFLFYPRFCVPRVLILIQVKNTHLLYKKQKLFLVYPGY